MWPTLLARYATALADARRELGEIRKVQLQARARAAGQHDARWKRDDEVASQVADLSDDQVNLETEIEVLVAAIDIASLFLTSDIPYAYQLEPYHLPVD